MNSITDEERQEVHRLLHQLWSKDVGTKEYDKKKWLRLESLLLLGLGPLPKKYQLVP